MLSEELREQQLKTLNSPRLKYGIMAKILFRGMDLFYSRKRTLSKFKVLELIARVPYQAWEHVAYIAMTHTYHKPDLVRRIYDFVIEARHQQDNEQWHLLMLEEITNQQSIPENFFMYRIAPQVVAFFYYHLSWILYVINPRLSYQLNAHFEDHAEHEYMLFAEENPEFETTPFESLFKNEYGDFNNLADLFRQIGLDERQHKEESLLRMKAPRFS